MKGTESRKNMKVATDSEGNLFDDEEDCVYCSEIVCVSTDSVRCDLCKHLFHQVCTGLSVDVFFCVN